MLEASATQSFADGLSCVSLKQIHVEPFYKAEELTAFFSFSHSSHM